MTLAARSICDGRCWVSSSWTGRAPGPNRDDHHALRPATRRPTVHGSRKSAGPRARISLYIISHLTVTFSSSSAACGARRRDPATRRAAEAAGSLRFGYRYCLDVVDSLAPAVN
jgi:hypothetical protein